MSFSFEEPEIAPKLFKTACASPACDSNVASSSALSSVDIVPCCRLCRSPDPALLRLSPHLDEYSSTLELVLGLLLSL